MRLLTLVLCSLLFSPPVQALDPVLLSEHGEEPRIAVARDHALVAWTDTTSLSLLTTLVQKDGNRLSTIETLTVGHDSHSLAIASDGEGFLAVWIRGGLIEGRLVDASGAVGPQLAIAAASTGVVRPRVRLTWSGTRYFMLVDNFQTATGIWISSSSGVVLRTFQLPVSNVVVAAHDEAIGMAWSRRQGRDAELMFAELRDDELTDARVIATEREGGIYATPFAQPRALAWNGLGYDLVWVEGQSGRTTVLRSGRLTPSGPLTDTNSIASLYVAPEFSAEEIHTAGGRHAVTYRFGLTLNAVWPTGFDPTPAFRLADAVHSPDVASFGDGSLMWAYVQNQLIGTNDEVYVAGMPMTVGRRRGAGRR